MGSERERAERALERLTGDGATPEAAQAAGAIFYTLPADLKPEQIDPLLRDIVFEINRSGWVWTGESCQGHPDASPGETFWPHNTEPFLRLVVHQARSARMLLHLAYALEVPDRALEHASRVGWLHSGAQGVRLYRDDRDPYDEFRVYLPAGNACERDGGIEVFRRFARSVNEVASVKGDER